MPHCELKLKMSVYNIQERANMKYKLLTILIALVLVTSGCSNQGLTPAQDTECVEPE